MKEVLSIRKCKDVYVALIYWASNKCTPYVVAWNCPVDKIEDGYFVGSWGQGHYFCELDGAVDYYNNNYKEEF